MSDIRTFFMQISELDHPVIIYNNYEDILYENLYSQLYYLRKQSISSKKNLRINKNYRRNNIDIFK